MITALANGTLLIITYSLKSEEKNWHFQCNVIVTFMMLGI